MKSAIALLACACVVVSLPPPHPDVVKVRREEEQLPPHLRKPALQHNLHLREILALTSLLHKGENLVWDREANEISRKEIYNILTHAGFVPRRSTHVQGDLHQPAVLPPVDLDLFNAPILQSQDFLQYL